MERLDAAEVTDPTAALHRLAERIRRKGLIILISDLLLPAETTEGDAADLILARWSSVLKHFRHQGHDVLVFHVLHPDEISFDFSGPVEFEGLEGEPKMLVDAWSVAHLYRRRMEAYLDRMQRDCRNNRVDYHRLVTTDPLDLALSFCLDKRQRLY